MFINILLPVVALLFFVSEQQRTHALYHTISQKHLEDTWKKQAVVLVGGDCL